MAVVLTPEQEAAVAAAEAGYSLALLGPAGSGKTVALRAIIAALKAKCKGPEYVAVTATSGMAASRIGGITLHKFMGMQLGEAPLGLYMHRIDKSKKLQAHWRNVKALIIDEISMGTGGYWSKAEALARLARGIDKPFGGIQVIVCGDFLQLPPVKLDVAADRALGASRKDLALMGYPLPPRPVSDTASAEAVRKAAESEVAADAAKRIRFAFESPAWSRTITHVIVFSSIHRQRDPEYAAALNELRVGRIHPLFRAMENRQAGTGGSKRVATLPPLAPAAPGWALQPTTLYALKYDVREENLAMLARLGLPLWRISCVTTGDRKQAEDLAEQFVGEKVLEVCVGAQVMLIRNCDSDSRLVNGLVGIVTRIATGGANANAHMNGGSGGGDGWVTTLEDTLPPQPAPAMLQAGGTGRAGGPRGQASMGGDTPPSLHAAKARAQDTARRSVPCGAVRITVRFTLHDGSELTKELEPETWEREVDGKVVATVSQLPLQLAWAITIHKSQGATLPKLRADLRSCFDWSQVYVVMSRGCTLSAMQVINFSTRSVKVHPRALAFHTHVAPARALETARALGSSALIRSCEAQMAALCEQPRRCVRDGTHERDNKNETENENENENDIRCEKGSGSTPTLAGGQNPGSGSAVAWSWELPPVVHKRQRVAAGSGKGWPQ